MVLHETGQKRRFARADHARTEWVLKTPLVRDHEARIYSWFGQASGPILELGAGEGLSLAFHPELLERFYIGSDLHIDRASAVRDQASTRIQAGGRCHALVCDAAELPFGARSLRTLLSRDLMHHLPAARRQHFVAELRRVLRRDGEAILIEPNGGRSPLMAAFALAAPTERQALEFNAHALRKLLAPQFASVEISHIEPSALCRLILHYRYGAPWLVRFRLARAALHTWEKISARLAPRWMWSYLVARCHSPR